MRIIILFYLSESNAKFSWAKNGIIEKARNYNSNIGYGLVQAYAADNILFKDIYSQGGVTLRLETDNLKMKEVGVGGVRNIFAKNIYSEDGLAAVMFSPHFMTNGKVIINDVFSKNSCLAVRVEEGFVEIFNESGETKEQLINRIESLIGKGAISIVYKRGALHTRWAARIKNEFSAVTYQKTGLKPGVFENCIVNNVNAVYGETAQYKANFLVYLNCDERQKVCQAVPNNNFYYGPSLAAVYDNTIEGAKFGSYFVQINNVSVKGFPGSSLPFIKNDTPVSECQSKKWPICQ